MTKEERAELFEMRVIGMLARMFTVRGVAPTDDEWQILRGMSDLDLRNITNIAHRMDFDLVLSVQSMELSE